MLDAKTRRIIWERAQGHCEITGAPLGPCETGPWECHHRRNKGMGGSSRANVDNPSNLMALTPRIHNGGPGSVHAHRPWAQRCGYLLPKHVAEPGMWPVQLAGLRPVVTAGGIVMVVNPLVLLGDDGRYHAVPSPIRQVVTPPAR